MRKPMKLIIKIPYYNEEQTIAKTLKDLPKSIPSIDVIETLIIDDGSNDKTIVVTKKNGVQHFFYICERSIHRNSQNVFYRASSIYFGCFIFKRKIDSKIYFNWYYYRFFNLSPYDIYLTPLIPNNCLSNS